jgi:hypothetical protein
LSVVLFGTIRLSISELVTVYACVIGPAVGIASIGATRLRAGLQSAKGVSFQNESSRVASGGFGPNQVAAVLSLAAVLCLLWAVCLSVNVWERGVLVVLGLGLMAQCALTFSRGGLYMAAGALGTGAWLLRAAPVARSRFAVVLAVLVVLAASVVYPRLNALTEGAITHRFEQVDTSGRSLLIAADLRTFTEHIVLGAGPGMGGGNRAKFFGSPQPAHTEYSRLLAEHGLAGALAGTLLVWIAVANLRRARRAVPRALAAAVMTWSLLFMGIDDTRLLAPSFAFGLGSVTIVARRKKGQTRERNCVALDNPGGSLRRSCVG